MSSPSFTDYFSADSVEWHASAACAGSSFNFVPREETASGVEKAQRWCHGCPVRSECLAWATLYRAEGYWGGTTTYQRMQLRRVRTRAKCPLCLSAQLVYTNPHELCLACGVSWIRDVREQPIVAKRVPQPVS
jgi:hypothetical protein